MYVQPEGVLSEGYHSPTAGVRKMEALQDCIFYRVWDCNPFIYANATRSHVEISPVQKYVGFHLFTSLGVILQNAIAHLFENRIFFGEYGQESFGK